MACKVDLTHPLGPQLDAIRHATVRPTSASMALGKFKGARGEVVKGT